VYVACLVADAEAEWNVAKQFVSTCKAELDQRMRAKIAARGEKTTESGIAAMVETHDDYVAAVDAEINARYQHQLLKSISSAMDMRSSMLISLGAHLRSEMDQTQMHISEFKDKLRPMLPRPKMDDSVPF
jgi:hypothetical protein